MNQLFKMYFSPFVNRGERGAKAATYCMTITLSLNEHSILIYIISFFQDVGSLGPIFFIGLAVLLLAFNFNYLEKRFVTNGRFESLRPSNRGLYVILMMFHFFFTCIATPIIAILVLEKII
jgi:hypothetical protein